MCREAIGSGQGTGPGGLFGPHAPSAYPEPIRVYVPPAARVIVRVLGIPATVDLSLTLERIRS